MEALWGLAHSGRRWGWRAVWLQLCWPRPTLWQPASTSAPGHGISETHPFPFPRCVWQRGGHCPPAALLHLVSGMEAMLAIVHHCTVQSVWQPLVPPTARAACYFISVQLSHVRPPAAHERGAHHVLRPGWPGALLGWVALLVSLCRQVTVEYSSFTSTCLLCCNCAAAASCSPLLSLTVCAACLSQSVEWFASWGFPW